MPLRPYRMPDGSVIFAGKDTVFRPVDRIDPHDVVEKHFCITAQEGDIPGANAWLEECIFQLPFEHGQLVDFSIAVSEAVRNAVQHGLRSAERQVDISIFYVPKVILLVGITDDLGPLKIEDIRLDVADEQGNPSLDTHGRGFYIMCALTSMVAYIPDDNSRLKELFLALVPKPD